MDSEPTLRNLKSRLKQMKNSSSYERLSELKCFRKYAEDLQPNLLTVLLISALNQPWLSLTPCLTITYDLCHHFMPHYNIQSQLRRILSASSSEFFAWNFLSGSWTENCSSMWRYVKNKQPNWKRRKLTNSYDKKIIACNHLLSEIFFLSFLVFFLPFILLLLSLMSNIMTKTAREKIKQKVFMSRRGIVNEFPEIFYLLLRPFKGRQTIVGLASHVNVKKSKCCFVHFIRLWMRTFFSLSYLLARISATVNFSADLEPLAHKF